MRRTAYLKQLTKDLETWIDAGLVPAQNRDSILGNAGPTAGLYSLPKILTMLGVILLGFAALSFIAANWSGLDKMPRLLILLSSLWICFGIAAKYADKTNIVVEAAVLLGCFLFGVNIMLIAQTYHIQAHYPDGVRLWAIGAGLAAIAIPSRAALVIAIVLTSIWSGLETMDFFDKPHLAFLLLWTPLAIAAYVREWRPALHLIAISFAIWATMQSVFLEDVLDYGGQDVLAFLALFWGAIWVFGLGLAKPAPQIASLLERYGLLLFITSLLGVLVFDPGGDAGTGYLLMAIPAGVFCFALYNAWDQGAFGQRDALILVGLVTALAISPTLIFLGDLTLFWFKNVGLGALFFWLLAIGNFENDKFMVNLVLIGIGAEILYIYFSTLGSLLGDAAFFAIGGVILIAFSIFFQKYSRSLTIREENAHD